VKAELSAFLDDTRFVTPGEKPPITQHYGDTFNSVDRFNRIFEHMFYLPRIQSEPLAILYSIFEIALIQTWALSQDWKSRKQYKEEYQYVRKFGIELVDQLLQ